MVVASGEEPGVHIRKDKGCNRIYVVFKYKNRARGHKMTYLPLKKVGTRNLLNFKEYKF